MFSEAILQYIKQFRFWNNFTYAGLKLNKSKVAGLHPTTKSNLRTALGVEICKLCIITRIWKPLSGKFSDLCREMGICSDVM